MDSEKALRKYNPDQRRGVKKMKGYLKSGGLLNCTVSERSRTSTLTFREGFTQL